MDSLDIFAFVVMFVILVSGIVVVVVLGKMPGDIAQKRGHPQSAAITACGWLGVLTGGLLWPIALIWAFTGSSTASDSGKPEPETVTTEHNDPTETIRQLTERIALLERNINTTGQVQEGTTS